MNNCDHLLLVHEKFLLAIEINVVENEQLKSLLETKTLNLRLNLFLSVSIFFLLRPSFFSESNHSVFSTVLAVKLQTNFFLNGACVRRAIHSAIHCLLFIHLSPRHLFLEPAMNIFIGISIVRQFSHPFIRNYHLFMQSAIHRDATNITTHRSFMHPTSNPSNQPVTLVDKIKANSHFYTLKCLFQYPI